MADSRTCSGNGDIVAVFPRQHAEGSAPAPTSSAGMDLVSVESCAGPVCLQSPADLHRLQRHDSHADRRLPWNHVGGHRSILVLFKMNRHYQFVWLVRRQLWVVAACVYVLVVLPVDVLIHQYNVRQILNGTPAPIVQITGHPVDVEALPVLLPLCEAQDEHTRTGIRAMLSQRFDQLRQELSESQELGWTAWQYSLSESYAELLREQPKWNTFSNDSERDAAYKRLSTEAFNN